MNNIVCVIAGYGSCTSGSSNSTSSILTVPSQSSRSGGGIKFIFNWIISNIRRLLPSVIESGDFFINHLFSIYDLVLDLTVQKPFGGAFVQCFKVAAIYFITSMSNLEKERFFCV